MAEPTVPVDEFCAEGAHGLCHTVGITHGQPQRSEYETTRMCGCPCHIQVHVITTDGEVACDEFVRKVSLDPDHEDVNCGECLAFLKYEDDSDHGRYSFPMLSGGTGRRG